MDQRGKRLLLIAAAVIVLFLGVTAYFIFFAKKSNDPQSVDVANSLFPFDAQSSQVNQLPIIGGDGQTTTGELEAKPVAVNSRERLRKITSFPVSGFVSFTTTEMEPSIVIDPKTNLEMRTLVPVTVNHVRYNDQRTGHMFDGIIEEGSILNTKLTKTDLPSAEELLFDTTGNTGLLRYERDSAIQTFKLIIPPPPTMPPYCTYATITTDLKSGSKGPEVRTLQQYINAKLNIKIATDGSFGKGTAARVAQIQKLFSLPQTSIADQATRTAITAECTEAQRLVDEAKAGPVELKGSLMSGSNTDIVRSDANILFLLQKVDGAVQGLLQPFSGGATTKVFESTFTEWLPQFVNKDLVSMTTYASARADGYLYALNPTTKTFSKLFGPVTALTTLTNPNGTRALVTFAENGLLVTKLVTFSTGEQRIMPFVTLPEKCSWYSSDQFYCGVPSEFPAALYPDDWYKGLMSFRDTLWNYTVSTDRAVQVALPSESIDMFRMQSNPTTEYLFFMNKNNYELWSYRIGGTN